MMNFLAKAKELNDFTVTMRRDFHRHPELGFEEIRTAGIVADTLAGIGAGSHHGCGQDRRGRVT